MKSEALEKSVEKAPEKVLGKAPESLKEPEIQQPIKKSEEPTKSPESVKDSEILQDDSQMSIPPGAITIEEENDSPLIDNAAMDDDQLSEIELAKNVEEFTLKKSQTNALPS